MLNQSSYYDNAAKKLLTSMLGVSRGVNGGNRTKAKQSCEYGATTSNDPHCRDDSAENAYNKTQPLPKMLIEYTKNEAKNLSTK